MENKNYGYQKVIGKINNNLKSVLLKIINGLFYCFFAGTSNKTCRARMNSFVILIINQYIVLFVLPVTHKFNNVLHSYCDSKEKERSHVSNHWCVYVKKNVNYNLKII
jgi:hypothetical protein